jgi:hypothetical protein
MRDLLYIIDMLAWFAVVKFVNQTPVWQPASYAMSSAVPALAFFIYIGIGASMGFSVPVMIADHFQPVVDAFGVVTVSRNIGVLGRLAQVVGVICGGYAGLRGIVVWNQLFLAGAFVRLLAKVAGYVLGVR